MAKASIRQGIYDLLQSVEVDTKEEGRCHVEPWMSQRMVIDAVAKGLNEGVHEFVVLKCRQVAITTVCSVIELFWALANPGVQGAIIAGEVTSVTSAGQGRKPSIGLQFDYLRLADGSTVDISATMTADQRKEEHKNGLKVIATTLGGMLLGNAIGKTIFHTGGGGVVGAAGGLLYGINGKTNFTLPSGSDVQITLNQTVTIRRQAPNSPTNNQ